MPPRRRDPAEVDAAVAAVLRALDADETPARADLQTATRGLAQRLAEQAPGRTVEVRVPPYAAVQCVDGPRHTRGTPPGVVETDPVTFVLLCTGRLAWADAGPARVSASGDRAQLVASHLPLSAGT